MSAADVLITGGAGFIGVNIAARLLSDGATVRILDSLARPGSEQNLEWLQERYADRLQFLQADIRDADAVRAAVQGVEHIVHLAAQVAVTTSLSEPREDFEVNACGALNVLEAARAHPHPPSLVYSSTNKVYGALADLELRANGLCYEPVDAEVRRRGVSERRALDFHSPYGCSKGAADQYILDYARSYGLNAVVLRMSCIYGPHQHGNEDQGWVAHFVRCAEADRPITIYGDGLQVRDVLFVEDLVEAFECVRRNAHRLRGCAFNIGGGPANAVSVLQVIRRIERLLGREIELRVEPWRLGDQRYYVADTAGFRDATGWRPQVGVDEGLEALRDWLKGDLATAPPTGAFAGGNAGLRAHA